MMPPAARHFGQTLLVMAILAIAAVEAVQLAGSLIAGDTLNAGYTDGSITQAQFQHPAALAVDGNGDILVGDRDGLRRIVVGQDVTRIAGIPGVTGFIDGAANESAFNTITCILYDPVLGLFVVDHKNNAIRLYFNDTVTTVAGSPLGDTGVDDGFGSAALFYNPSHMVLGPDGYYYITDMGNHIIRKMTANGSVTTLPISLYFPSTAVADGVFLFVANVNENSEHQVSRIRFSDFSISTPPAFGDELVTGMTFAYGVMYFSTRNQVLRVVDRVSDFPSFIVIAGRVNAYGTGLGADPAFQEISSLYCASPLNDTNAFFVITQADPNVNVVGVIRFPSPPIPVLYTVTYPNIFPTDNTTEMQIIYEIIGRQVDAAINGSGTFVGNYSIDQASLQIIFNISVPAYYYDVSSQTNTTVAAANISAPVLEEVERYYSFTVLNGVFDQLHLPITDAVAMATIKGLVLQDIQNLMVFGNLGVWDPTFTNSSVVYKLDVPIQFAYNNATTTEGLATFGWPLVSAFLKAYYSQTVVAFFNNSLHFPFWNATMMALLQNAVALDAKDLFAFDPASAGPAQWLPNGTQYQLLVPPSFGGANATTPPLLASAGWPRVLALLAQVTSPNVFATFPTSMFPIGNVTAMELIRQLVLLDAADLFVCPCLGVGNPRVVFENGTTLFPLNVPMSFENTTTFSLLEQNATWPRVNAFLAHYYAIDRPFDAIFPASTLPLNDPVAMAAIRRLMGKDLDALLGTTDIAVNGDANVSNGVAFFSVIVPSFVANSSTAGLIRDSTWPSVYAYLSSYFWQPTVASPTSGLPSDNATALSEIQRRILTMLQLLLSPAFQGPSTPILGDPTTVFPVSIPNTTREGSSPPITQEAIDAIASTVIAQYMAAYYATDVFGTLPSADLPWSDPAAMEAIRQLLVADAKVALRYSLHVDAAPGAVTPPNVNFQLTVPASFSNASTAPILQAYGYPSVRAFLAAYYATNASVALPTAGLPFWNGTAMDALQQYLLLDVQTLLRTMNIAVNASTPGAAAWTYTFLLPTAVNNQTTVEVLADGTNKANVDAFLAQFYAQNLFASWPSGLLPLSNATAMAELQALVQLDAQELFGFPYAAAGPGTANASNANITQFQLRVPAAFDNATTAENTVPFDWPRATAYLARLNPPPFMLNVTRSQWAAAAMPTGNSSAMVTIRRLVALDAQDALGHGAPISTSAFFFTGTGGGRRVTFQLTLPQGYNNVSTSEALSASRWPRVTAFLASSSNLIGVDTQAALAPEQGCSNGCVIGVAAAGALVVTGCIIAGVVYASKRKRLAKVVAPPTFQSVFEDDPNAKTANPLTAPKRGAAQVDAPQ